MDEVRYTASKTLRQFHHGEGFVRGLMGPIGSGKSVGCVAEMVKISRSQKPYKGRRYTRWVIVRNTYRELQDTTIETFFDWVPKSSGHWSALNTKFTQEIMLQDGTIMCAEFLFRALDRPDDVKKLLSLEMTGMWINEAREIPKAIVDMGIGRLGRYPSKRVGGPSWHGLIMDTNPPDSDHWWYKLFEEDLPDNHQVFKQPSGVCEDAENVDNLPPGYYQNMQGGKDQEWINVYVHGKYGFVMDGKPVWVEYHDDLHHTDDEISIPKGVTIGVGIDFGLTPAAAIGFVKPSGQLVILDELVGEDIGAKSFGKILHQRLATKYSGYDLEVYGDPAGEQRAQTDERTPFEILSNVGIEAWPTYTNDFTIRRECIADQMCRLDFSGEPAFLIGPGAPLSRKACAGGYKYKRVQVSGEARYQDKPDKGRYSHIGDAIQYLGLGLIGGDQVVGGFSKGAELDYSAVERGIV